MKLDKTFRKKVLLLLIVILTAMLIPMKIHFRDGGTIEYKAVLYSVTNLHRLTSQNNRFGTLQGTRIRVLCFNVYDDAEFIPDDIEHVLSPAN